jgi:hypothetical protein
LEPIGKIGTVDSGHSVLEIRQREPAGSKVSAVSSGEWELVAQIDQLMRQADRLTQSGGQAEVVLACRLRRRAHELGAVLARMRLLRALAAPPGAF